MMGHEGLASYFKNNFSLMHHHKWDITAVESMIPWEREIYIELLSAFQKEEEQKMRDRENEMKSQMASMQNRRKM